MPVNYAGVFCKCLHLKRLRDIVCSAEFEFNAVLSVSNEGRGVHCKKGGFQRNMGCVGRSRQSVRGGRAEERAEERAEG